MKQWRLAASIFFILCIILAAGCGKTGPAGGEPAAPLTVKVLDIGQGDAIFIRTPEQTILVDTGDTGTR